MIARITRIILLVQFLAGLGIYLALRPHWSPLAAALLAALIVLAVRMLITANNFFIAMRFAGERPVQFHLTPAAALRMYLEEFGATFYASSWSMPFRRFQARYLDDSDGLPVLLVHGYACNSGYWNSMSQALKAGRISHRALDLEPVGGSIDDYAEQINDALETLCRETGSEKAIIVAHSMGGLATRACLRVHGTSKVAGVITLGTPHHGTGLANLGLGENSRQMRWHGRRGEGKPNDWLREMGDLERPELRALFVSIWSHHDNIIAPQSSSVLPGAKNIEFHGIGHVALAVNARIQKAVIEELRRISATAASRK